jgi:peptidoglycan/LPS O-acetylase OafA/YrhL
MNSRNHSLDILRGLAILLVINCHAASTLEPSRVMHCFQLGGKGVDLFFVLSGWLLGNQLLLELTKSGTIDIKRFWYRRWLRTLPAYYAVLAFTFLWQIAAKSNWALCWSYLAFGQNYSTELPYFSVSWSLCVEEHFYLVIAPLLLVFFRVRLMLCLLPVILLTPACCRYLGWYHSLHETHVRYDFCAVGVLLAYARVACPRLWHYLCRTAPILAVLGVAVAGYNVVCRLNPDWQKGDVNLVVWLFVFGAFVLLANSGEYWKRKLRVPGFRYLADRSYALYLLHPEALAVARLFLKDIPVVLYFVLTWMLCLVLAEILYRSIELPFMQAREWFPSTWSKKPVPPLVSLQPQTSSTTLAT